MSARLDPALEDVCRTIRRIRQRTVEASRMVDVVEEVSDQTRVSALNAALASSHLGEDGMELSALAEEIRRHVDRSEAAAREIARSLDAIQEATDEALRAADALRALLIAPASEP